MTCSCHSDGSLYGSLVTCPACGHRSFDRTADACERRRCPSAQRSAEGAPKEKP